MTSPRLIAFDLDDTLAPSKTAIDPRMGDLLLGLADRVEVAIISGGQLQQFQSQVVERLPQTDAATLSRFHLMPTCGTQYYRLTEDGIETIYALSLTEDEKARALSAVEEEAVRLGLWETETWGPILEDRGSQITFSALGQAAPLDAKTAWDPTGAKKNALRDAVAARIPDLEVRSGGSTSVDITHRGIDKAYGMRKLAEQTGIHLDDMLFVGDRLDEHGNDYPVLAMGVTCHAVEGWEDTAAYLDDLIPSLPAR
ncbi:HAD-IIB family hydrolase [Microbacterium sp. EYE_5]|uniref:HAD-IIB family hydrolase n=1 Tax=unclassified Microbacterium TaxID=2609290 RepID=UPI002002B913|nr:MULTISPECIES: HAD-IIB family hydrolase [unclassified Microbacterium]MCK6080335.1 HAD-IIB family hydrolase [Microbacterium sp. EYE_382]MCK6085606.1 HAD-IIB family hydrolase [Microbacterium sp. EYE_384]MCK6122169.1 HAD-IIB family hydrolase [Microbacterium sp. EYE_80]MCK6126369.1 HAD-IIB family hydrolase [Microbacterium sp. EYE_79]MCK6141290.1 HAD-IIB family hydrolase [Microbacterium sp. EYE_39]